MYLFLICSVYSVLPCFVFSCLPFHLFVVGHSFKLCTCSYFFCHLFTYSQSDKYSAFYLFFLVSLYSRNPFFSLCILSFCPCCLLLISVCYKPFFSLVFYLLSLLFVYLSLLLFPFFSLYFLSCLFILIISLSSTNLFFFVFYCIYISLCLVFVGFVYFTFFLNPSSLHFVFCLFILLSSTYPSFFLCTLSAYCLCFYPPNDWLSSLCLTACSFFQFRKDSVHFSCLSS